MINGVSHAYSLRAQEYVEQFGSMDAVHPEDRQLVETWARGIDVVPEFIERAQRTYPEMAFATGSLNALEVPEESVAAVLAWFALIHHEPADIQLPLQEFRRALQSDGTLLIGFFEGPAVEQFAHAVTPAYRWPVDALSDELRAAGFDVIDSHLRRSPEERSQAAIVATAQSFAKNGSR